MKDNTSRFSGIADQYARYRPTYSAEFMDYLYGEIGFDKTGVIADIGAGTGIFSKLLLERGSRVICIEPNNDMLRVARETLSGFQNCTFDNSPAEKTTLPDQSVDYITAAQAFHWFDEERFQAECQRILKENGKVVLVWNARIPDAESVIACDEINRRYCPEAPAFSGGQRGIVPDHHAGFFKNGLVDYKTFANDYTMDEDGFIGRILSSSYALKEDNANFSDYIAELKQLFAKYSVDGTFKMPNVIHSYIGYV